MPAVFIILTATYFAPALRSPANSLSSTSAFACLSDRRSNLDMMFKEWTPLRDASSCIARQLRLTLETAAEMATYCSRASTSDLLQISWSALRAGIGEGRKIRLLDEEDYRVQLQGLVPDENGGRYRGSLPHVYVADPSQLARISGGGNSGKVSKLVLHTRGGPSYKACVPHEPSHDLIVSCAIKPIAPGRVDALSLHFVLLPSGR